MKPIYESRYIAESLYDRLIDEVPWVNRDAPRDECFMALEELEYTYGDKITRTYTSVSMNDMVKSMMNKLNEDFDCEYNICFLNYYKNEKEFLGWHADDSPEMDSNHPIAVISFGAEREIWTKKMGEKGVVPDENKYSLEDGSLFIMPAGFQENNLHRIPKCDRPCGGRVSLTFRKYKAVE
jgi:alkylated DNA repair dioxygenase AlkB